MKHLGYSSLNGLGLSTSSSRSSRMIRTVQDTDRKKNVDKRKEQRVKEKIETPAVKRSRASSKDSTSEPIPPPLKIARPSVEKTITTTSSAEMPTSTTLTVSSEKALITPIVSDSSNKPIKIEEVKEFIPISTMESNHQKLSTKSSTIQHEQKPVSKTKSSSSAQQQTIAASSTSLMATYNEKKAFIPAPPKAVFSSSAEPATGSNELLKKVPKCLLSTTTTTTTTTLTFSTSDVKTLKLKKQNREGQKAVNSVKLIPISRTKSSDSVSSAAPNSLLATKKQKHVMKSMKRKTHGSDMMATSSDEDATKHKQKHRRSSMGKESSRVKSPLGHQAVEEQDVGYTNANIFTRFYQGQKVHARHHLRFYDARIVIVKQPSLAEIAKSLVNAFELGRITHTSSPRDLNTISLANMGNELKDALKSMVNTTKCFVHYLGWNSRYDEWLMLHKIRIDEKDDKASTKALEALIPNELSPQLFTVAMDWCVSAEGIPALASTHAYASDQQRPRRLSSSGGNRIAKTSNASAAGTDACGTSQHSSIVAAASSMSSGSGFQSSKYVVSHHSASVLGVKSTASSLLSGEQGLSSTFGSGASSASTVFAYQSPLNATSVSRSPTASAATAAAAANLLLINTSYGQQHYQHQQPIKHNDSGHSSPLSPVLQQQRLFAYQQQSQHYQRPLMEMATSTTKFIIPHIQRGEQNKTSLLDKYTSSISAGRIELGTIEEVTKVPVCATSNLTASEAGLLAVSNLPIGDVQSSSSIIVTESDTIIDRSTNNHTTNEQTSTFISSLSRSNISTLPIGIQHYQSGVAASSSFLISSSPLESHSLSSEVILPPPPLPPLASSLIPSVKDSSSFSSSSNFSTTSVLPLAGEDVVLRLGTENIFAGASADATEKSLFIHVNLRKREEAEHNAIIYSLMHNITAKFLVKNEGVCLEEQCLMGITTNLKSGIQPIISQANNTLVATTDLSVMAAAGDASSAFALSIVGGRTSPITTISSCGAVEDFDENSSSIRQTETPGFNEDDECASVLSLDAKVSKSLLHSPIPMRSMHRSALNRERNGGHNHSRSPCTVGVADTSAIAPTTRTSTPRLLRRRVASSKSPDTSGDEDIFEGQITHADSSHAARLRVQQRMETEHLFASYSFIGLPELDDLLKNANNCEESIKIMEDRMQILRDIYQNFRGKLSRLEKRHKRAMIKKKQQVKDTKERGNLPSSNADDTAGRDSLVTNAANLIDEQPTYEASPDDRPMRTESPFASLSEKKDKLETIST